MRLLLIPHLFKLANVVRLFLTHRFKSCDVLSLFNAYLFKCTDALVSSLELFTKHSVVFLDTLGDSTLALDLNLDSLQVVELNKVIFKTTRLVDLRDRARHNSVLCGSKGSGDSGLTGAGNGSSSSLLRRGGGSLTGRAEHGVSCDFIVEHGRGFGSFSGSSNR